MKPVTTISGDARIKELTEKIHEMPYGPVHDGYTPAVGELIQIGPSVLQHMLNLMLSDDYEKRKNAEVVIREVTMDMLNDAPKNVYTSDEEGRWLKLWQDMGNLDAQAPLEQRKKSIENWRLWLATRKNALNE